MLKLAEDEYVEWGSIVDAPVSYAMGRAAAVDEFGEERVARADKKGHSYRDLPPVIVGNRAGPGESSLSLEELRRSVQPEGNA